MEQKFRKYVAIASHGTTTSVNATLKTGFAMSIVVVGAVAIHEAFQQESWWYGSGLAMAWGAAVSWVRNLV